MVEIYQERRSGGRGGDGPAASAPVTPSRRRGLSSSSDTSHDDVLRRKKVLTPKHPNNLRRGGGNTNTDDKRGLSHKKKRTSSMVKTSGSTETATMSSSTSSSMTKGRKESRIGKPRARVSSMSGVGVPAAATNSAKSDEPSAQATTSSALTTATLNGTRTSTSSTSKLSSRAKMSLRTTRLGGKAARMLPTVESKVEETSQLPAESKNVSPAVAIAEESSSSRTMGEETSPPAAVATPARMQTSKSTGRNDDSCNVRNTKTTTPPSTGSLREFIQQRRNELKSEEKMSSGDGGDGTSIAITTTTKEKKKSVTFDADTSFKTMASSSSSSDQQHETSGGILMDLSNAFGEESMVVKTNAARASARTTSSSVKKDASTKKSAATKSLPVLCLGKFQESLWLDFGDESRNVVGKTRSLSFLLEAPEKSSSAAGASESGYWSVEFERIPFKKGFNLIVEDDDKAGDALSAGNASGNQSNAANSLDDNSLHGLVHANVDDDATAIERTSPTVLCIKNGDKKKLRLTWTPTEAGGVREAVHLKLPRGRIRITAHGKARAMNNRDKSKKKAVAVSAENYARGSIKSASEPPVTPHRSVRKAPSVGSRAATPAPDFSTPRTVFSKSSPAGSVTSASKVRCHIKYDSEWAEKQCDAYAKWLNYSFQPTEDVAHENSLHDGGDGDSCQSSRTGLRTLLLHRRRAQARKQALELYQTDEMKNIRHSIEAEVDSGKLSIRSDRDVFADVGLRGQIMSLLMSYSTPWLRLGLETIFGEILSSDISATSNSRSGETVLRPRAMLKRFIVERVFSDPALCKKYTGGRHATSNKTLSGRFDREYKEAMRQHSLRCILLLVTFLDKAKMQNVLESVPCLFTRKAEVKSSKDVITAICRDLLFKEGNIFKHLSRLGLTVKYKQEPIDEFDYAVENLAVDLRDGVRLARMAEILTNDSSSSLTKQMRLPTISRLQKLHNTEVALSALVDAGVPNLDNITTHHIVDGHRPRVLKLLWSTIAHFKLPSLLDLDLLRQEIANVTRANRSRRVLSMRYIGNQQVERDEAEIEEARPVADGAEAKVGGLLLAWCQAVCSCFGLPVKNFTSSFADGKVLCLLIHYYHPGMLKRSEVLPTTHDLPKDVAVMRSGERYHEALSNERKNSTLANKRVTELGGVPGMLPITDSCHIPEEKSTLLCLAYLCSRLMESSKEILATIAIQNCYRRYQDRILRERKKVAAVVIFRHWRENKASYFATQRQRYGASIRVIEKFLCRNKDKIVVLRARREKKQAKFISICRLQGAVRRWIAVRKYQNLLVEFSAAKVLQATYRGFSQRCRCAKMQSSSIVIQSTYRGHKALCSFQVAQSSAVIIQKSWRGFVVELQFQCTLLNIIAVQSYIRRRAAIRTAEQRRVAVIRVQTLARQKLAIHHIRLLSTQFKAAAIIQGLYRRRQARKAMESVHSSAIKIQTSWRRFQAELQYMDVLMDTICIQCYARRLIARQQARSKRSSINRIQQAVRLWLSQRQLAVLRMDRAESQRIEAAAIVCQSLARRIVAVKRFEKMSATNRAANHAAATIQACYRGARSRQLISGLHASVTRIQSAWRRFSVELKFECTLMDIVYAQACARRFLGIVEAGRRRAAVVVLQCAVRKCIAIRRVHARTIVNKEVDSFVAAVVVCQSVARRRMAVNRVNRKRSKVALLNKSTVKIQTIWRGYSAEIRYQFTLLAIICIQSIVRRHQAARVATSKATSVVTLQCMARQWLARRELATAKKLSEEEMAYRHLCASSSIEIQRMVRGLQARTGYKMHVAARHIQKTWRGYVQHVDFMVSILSAIAIQTCTRKMICRRRFQMTKLAVAALQGLARGAMVRALVKEEIVAATRIQSWYRGAQAVNEYQNNQRAAIVMQSAVRGVIARRSIDFEHYAAREIQRVWRGYQANVDYIMILLAAIQIQSVARMFSARKVLASWNEKKLSAEVERRHRNASARQIQRVYKKVTMERFLARNSIIIQRSIRAFIARRRAAKMTRLVVFVQSAFRARLVRRMRTKKARVAARRIEKANEKAESEPQMRLGVRTSAALEVLQTSKRLSEVIRAIKTLEVSTRLSETCCRAFATANAPEILYALVRTCNRSLPHIELLHFVLLTLKNVARHPYLLPSVATHDSLEVLLDLTQMFRDKENIFCLSIALLERIVFCDESLMDMCRSSENIKRLKGIHALCKRRQNMARSTPKGSVQYDLKRGIHTLEKILRRCKV